MAKDLEKEKELAAKEAVKYIKDNFVVGLGTGSTATYAIKEIGKLVKDGLKITAVTTSNKTKELAETLGIPVFDLNEVEFVDITIDGADEFNDEFVLIKGGGGALLKEKIVASMTKQEIIIADSSKKVDQLGKFPLPVEVIPFATNYVMRELARLNGQGKVRQVNNTNFITDEGNYIIDTNFGYITNPASLSTNLNQVEGIVAHGLFIGLAQRIIVGVGETAETIIYEKHS